jgi:hypothetical protein
MQYIIRVKETLSPQWFYWLEGTNVTHADSGATVLTVNLPDQSALRGLLNHLFDFNLTLLSIELTGE